MFLDGFFPRTGADERPRRAPRTAGLAELGLPYEPEPAITAPRRRVPRGARRGGGRGGRARAARRASS